jgi:hypothetical protein
MSAATGDLVDSTGSLAYNASQSDNLPLLCRLHILQKCSGQI